MASLRHLLEVDPSDVNGRAALLVQRENEEGVAELRQATAQDDANPWAQRNLGAGLLKLGQASGAIAVSLRETGPNPQNERAWYGLGQGVEVGGVEAEPYFALILGRQAPEGRQAGIEATFAEIDWLVAETGMTRRGADGEARRRRAQPCAGRCRSLTRARWVY